MRLEMQYTIDYANREARVYQKYPIDQNELRKWVMKWNFSNTLEWCLYNPQICPLP